MSHPNGSAEFVYEHLREQILQWRLPPGAAVREAHVAEELGVSRTPVRAALQRLQLEGFLAARGKRGLQAPRWTLEELEETYRLRAHLEEWVGASAAQRRERLDLPRLHRLADEMTALAEQAEVDLERIAALNVEFHDTILNELGNARLRQLMSNVVVLPLLYRVFHLRTEAEMKTTLVEHHTLLLAIEQGDAQWAGSLSRAHILGALAAVVRGGIYETKSDRKPRSMRSATNHTETENSQ